MSYPDNKQKTGKVIIISIIALLALVVIAGAGFFAFQYISSKEATTEEESISKEGKNKKDKKDKKDKKTKKTKKDSHLSEISSLGDTAPPCNVLGNSYVVTDGTNIFIKSQYNNFELYSYPDTSGTGNSNPISKHSPGQMYYYKDYIYYSAPVDDKNVPGSVAIYRAKADGSSEEMLMPFDTDTYYLVLDALYDGKLYFTFNKEVADGKSIYQMDLETLDVQLLYNIPADIATEFPLVNVTNDGLYFHDKEGLKKLNPESKEAELVIKDLDAMYYTIYNGYVYYSRSKKGKHDENVIRRVFLDGSDDELIYTGTDVWIYDITAFVLNDKLFILSESEPDTSDSYGNLHSCELDGSNLITISDNANSIGMTDKAIYYSFVDNSKITTENTAAKKIENIRSVSTYKREVSTDGEISDEYIFLDPEPLNRAWVSYQTPIPFYNPEVQGFYKTDFLYYDESGKLYKNSWKNIDGRDYYFGEDGRMYSQEYTPDGYFVGLDGTVSDFIAPFKFIYNEYPFAGMYIKTDMYNDSVAEGFYKGDKISNVIDRGQVYEITNANIFATTSFSEEEVAPMEAGYSMYLKGPNLFCTVTGKEGYNEEFKGECIGLKQSRYPDVEIKLVKREGSDRYVLRGKTPDAGVTPLSSMIYSGSLYVTKDAKLDIYKTDNPNEAPVETTFGDYHNSFRETFAQNGQNPDEFYFTGNIIYYDTVKGTYAISKVEMYN